MARLTLTFFGSFQASLDGKPLTKLSSPRIQALLAYLVLEAERAHTRDVLAGLLWPDEPDPVAKQNLRQALYQLRQLLSEQSESTEAAPFLWVTRDTVQFNPTSDYALDVAQFLQALKQGNPQAAVALYQGELLDQLTSGSDRFEEWLMLQREHVHILAVNALHQLTEEALAQADAVQAQSYARHQLALEPWREQAHRQLMLALVRGGDRSAALTQYETCRRILAEELDVEPDGQTQALVEQIKNAECGAQGAPRSAEWTTTSTGWGDTLGMGKPVIAGADSALRTPHSALPIPHSALDWGDAPDIGVFYGRTRELAQLSGWMIGQRCRVIAILGMGGMGKTTLAAQLVRQCTAGGGGPFEFVLWRSLLNAPTINDLLDQWLRFLAHQQLAQLPSGLDAQLNLLFDYLRQHRCLLILDNAESIMQDGERAGHYRAGYEAYGQLLLRLGQSAHQSCLLLTSREQPRELSRLEAETPLVRSLPLTGLEASVGGELLRARGVRGPDASTAALVEHYSGNPLALKLVAEAVQDIFDGDIAAFLGDEAPIFDDIRDVLDQQFARLAPLEQDLLFWLAIEREPLTEAQLWQAFSRNRSKRSFLEALRSLQRRSLLENYVQESRTPESPGSAFGLQNVVTEYLTDYVVTQVCREFETALPTLLHSHALIKANAKEYVRQSQQRILLQSIGERLLGSLGRGRLEAQGKKLLETTRRATPLRPSFLAGNLLNLFLHLGIDLRGYDFSLLSVWQAYLRGADLPAVDFTHADLAGSVFTDYVGAVIAVAISPDGQFLAAGVDNGTIYLWQLADRQLIGVCQGHQGHISTLAFRPLLGSPEGSLADTENQQLVSASDDQTVRIWDVNTRRTLHILTGHTGGVACAAFHPDGRTVVSGGADRTVRVWDANTGQCLQTLQEHSDMVVALAFMPGLSPTVGADEVRFVTGSYDQTVRLWDRSRKQVRHTLYGHTGPVRVVAFSPRPVVWGQRMRTLLASGSYDQTLRLWDADSGELLASLTGHSAPVISATFSMDGALLMSGSDDQTVRVWDIAAQGADLRAIGDQEIIPTPGQTIGVLQGHYGAVVALAAHPQQAGGQGLLVTGSYDKTVRLWEVQSGRTLAILRGQAKWLQALVFAPTDSSEQHSLAPHRLLVSGSDGQNVRVWDGHTGRVLHTLRGHTSQTEKMAFRADGAQLASASWDKTARIWDLRHPQRAQNTQILQGHTAPVVAVVIGRDATGRSLIASGSLDHTVRLWDAETGQAVACWHGHSDRVVAFAFRPAPKEGNRAGVALLASGSWDRTIGLWEIQSGELVRFLHGHTAPIECVAFHPGGKLLASGSWDGSVRVWDVQTGETLHTFLDHANGLEMVAFSPDGVLLASCACDHLVCVWHVPEGRLLYKLPGHSSWVRCIAFSADSTLLASGSDDGTVKLWDVTPSGAGLCRQTIAMEDPYTGMKITGATGISEAQQAALKALGAVEEAESLSSVLNF